MFIVEAIQVTEQLHGKRGLVQGGARRRHTFRLFTLNVEVPQVACLVALKVNSARATSVQTIVKINLGRTAFAVAVSKSL